MLKAHNEVQNIQVVRRKWIDKDTQKYAFNLISKDKLNIFKNSQNNFERLIKINFKTINGYLNIYEEVLNNFLENKKQYNLLNRIVNEGVRENKSISFIYDILIINVCSIGGRSVKEVKEEIQSMQDAGYNLRMHFVISNKENVDNKLRGYIYKLINALSVNNQHLFMETIVRMYAGIGWNIPSDKNNGFAKMLGDEDSFKTLGYAYILGIKGSNGKDKKSKEDKEEKKEEIVNE